tara:strand:- start:1520 stop:2578 length:1059 start_codon:yes stop_codon:yes gene_type:complete
MTTFANRYVSVAVEHAFGDAQSVDAYGEVDEESFNETFDVLQRPDMNRYGAQKAVDSKHYASGSFSMPLQPDQFTMICLHGVMGTHTQGSTPGVNDKLEELATGELPSYTFRVGRDDKEYTFAGQVIESISVSSSVGEYAMMTVNTTGCKAQHKASDGSTISLGSLATPAYTYTGDAAHFVGAYVNFEDLATTSAYSKLVQSIDFEISTNRDMDNSYTLGSDTCVRAPPIQLREISGSITFSKAVLSGDVAVDEPDFADLLGSGSFHHGTASNPAISVLFQVDSNNEIRFDFFKVHYDAPQTNVSGRDTQTMTVGFTALYDETTTDMMEILFSSEDTTLKGGSNVDIDTLSS